MSYFSGSQAVRENCPKTKFFLVRILSHYDRIRRDTAYLTALSPNAGKYRPEKTLDLDTFHAVMIYIKIC